MYFNYILVAIIAYFIGNFSTSYIVTQKTANIDIREHGSGNAGTTNVLRLLGIKHATLTFIGDAIKGIIAVWIGNLILGDIGGIIAGISVVVGHNWPVFLKFKGGKGIASTIGVIFMINPLIGGISLAIGVTIIFIFKYVSLGSVLGITALPILTYLLKQPKEYIILGIVLAILAIYRHIGNIQRLFNGTEAKLGQRNKLK